MRIPDVTTRKALVWILGVDVVVIGVALIVGEEPHHLFKERHATSWFSVAQLLLVGVVAFAAHTTRRGTPGLEGRTHHVWALVGLGFVFLSLDDALEIHERMDRAIHDIFGLRETTLTDKIDDVIVLLYGVIGLVVLWRCRDEIRLFRATRPILAAAFVVALLMVGLDIFTNGKAGVRMLLDDKAAQKVLLHWLKAAEEALKILAGGLLLLSAYDVLRRSRRLAESSSR